MGQAADHGQVDKDHFDAASGVVPHRNGALLVAQVMFSQLLPDESGEA
jgi:hypothetical protein